MRLTNRIVLSSFVIGVTAVVVACGGAGPDDPETARSMEGVSLAPTATATASAAPADAGPKDAAKPTDSGAKPVDAARDTATCRYKNWSVPFACNYWCVSTEIGGGGYEDNHSGTLSGTASCSGGSCAAAADAAEQGQACPPSYPVVTAGMWTATCNLSSGPDFGGVSCQTVY